MIKQFLKNAIYRIYLVGKFEDYRRNDNSNQPQNNLRFSDIATIAEDANMVQGILHNRYKNKDHIVIGRKAYIRGELEVSREFSKIIIGDYSYVGPGSKIYCSKNITIGNRVLIAHNVNIYDNNSHPLDSVERYNDFGFIFKNGYQHDDIDVQAKEIIIEDDVWIGFNTIILKGVTIGKGAIIGAGTIITENIPPFAVVVGNPARIVKYTT